MAVPSLQQAPSSQYLAAVERIEEMARVQAQAQRRKSMLIFGPETVGKTRLLESFVKTQPLALYVSHLQSPRDLVLALVERLRSLNKRDVRLPSNPKALSTSSLKGIIQRALDQGPFMLALDHLSGPSRVVTGMIKEMNYYGRTPIFFAARTPHMEDIGTLLPMCSDRSERVEVKNLTPPIALEFAQREVERTDLWASNLESAALQLCRAQRR